MDKALSRITKLALDFAALTQEEKAEFASWVIAISTQQVQVSQETSPKVKESKLLDPATDVDVAITPVKAGRGKVAFTLGYGAGRAGAKLQIKAAGFAWDATLADDNRHGAWVGTTAQAKEAGVDVKAGVIHTTAEFVQQGRDKAQAKAARKAAKAS